MKFADVVTLTQNAVAQTLGETYMQSEDGTIKPLESFKLADVGSDVIDGSNSLGVDVFVKSLVTQIGKMVVTARKYTSELPSIFVDSYDWGGYVERVYFAPQDLIKDEMYNLVDGETYDDHKFYQPNTKAKIFAEGKTIMCPISIVRDQMFTAFSSLEQMNTFISGIYTNVENTITLGMESYAHMLISCGIVTSDKVTRNSVHLLTEYNDIASANLTPKTALKDYNFLKWSAQRIDTIKSQMARYTTAFNNGSIPTFTTPDNANMALLADYDKAVKFNVLASTYHNEEVGLGKHDVVTAWQAFKEADKTEFNFETNSKIEIAADANNKLGAGTDSITVSNCIGIIYDKMAMGICPHKSKVTSNYTAIADFWNQYHHELVNYILDANFNMVAFMLD